MTEINKNDYPDIPSEFHTCVCHTLENLPNDNFIAHHSKKTATYMILIAAAIAVLATITVFAGGKIHEQWIEKTNYKVDISVPAQVVEKPYVNLKFNYLPEGLVKADEYHYNSKNNSSGLSLSLFKLDDKETMEIKYSVGYQEREFGNNKGAIITKPDNFDYNRELIIYFENDGYLFRCYVSKGISDEELEKIAAGVELVETDEAHAFNYDSNREQESQLDETCRKQYEMQINEKHTFSTTDVIGLGEEFINLATYSDDTADDGVFNARIDKIEILDNVSNFNQKGFREGILEQKNLCDQNGNVLSYNRQEIIRGDGINSVDEVISQQNMKRKFIYVTITITNTSNSPRVFFANSFYIDEAQVDGEIIKMKTTSSATQNLYGEVEYITPGDTDGSLGRKKIKANGSITVGIGFFADEDKLDSLYIMPTTGQQKQIIKVTK